MCITFVTSLINIYEEDYDTNKTIEWRIERFREIAGSGIHICLYVSTELVKLIPKEYENVHIIEFPNKSFIEGKCEEINVSLPQQRNINKDTIKYLYAINSKTELLSDAIHSNIWGSTHFAWIDFNISHVFLNKERTLRFLRELDVYEFPKTCMLIPGCWSKYDNINIGHVTECIYWRFCGGFFIGDKTSILNFDSLYKTMFPSFVKEYKRLIWEVNFWAWLEVNSNWNPQWYPADHNDSIITNIPCANIVTVLKPHVTEIEYDYPRILLFHSGSASYLKFNGEHLLNTKYVNYWYNTDGSYLFYHRDNIIRNKNMFSQLVLENGILMPTGYDVMKDDSIELPKYNMYSRGIEDIRLYEHNGRVRFIATTVGYHSTGGNRMVIGNYDYNTISYSDVKLIESPTNAHCEKNWIPIPSSDGAERFIYKWNPLTIVTATDFIADGDINSRKKINITQTFPITEKLPFFQHMKGSSIFIEYNGELIGVTHFSEDAMPRRYFHMLVVLDRTTYAPLRYSKPFIFDKVGIEFCIGFDVSGNKYRFWISRFDRNPISYEININLIFFHDV